MDIEEYVDFPFQNLLNQKFLRSENFKEVGWRAFIMNLLLSD